MNQNKNCILLSDQERISNLKLDIIDKKFEIKEILSLPLDKFDAQTLVLTSVIQFNIDCIILNTCSLRIANTMYDHAIRFFIEDASVEKIPDLYIFEFDKPEVDCRKKSNFKLCNFYPVL